MRPATWLVFAIALTAVGAGTGWADVSSVIELEKTAERVNAAADVLTTPRSHQRVVMALAHDFKVTEDTVTALHTQRKLSYGDIAIALALAGELAKRDRILMREIALTTILARRDAGLDWSRITHEENLNVSKVVADVRRMERAVAHVQKVEKAERGEKPRSPDKLVRVSKIDRPERVERPGKQ